MNEIYFYGNKDTVYVVDMAVSISPFKELLFLCLVNSLVVVITAS